ncbi:MAG: DUF2065 domain-containing protein, partial [Deltaproteobacteria bacterium]
PYFAFPERMKEWVKKVVEMPESTLRVMGLVLITLGLLFVYFGRT